MRYAVVGLLAALMAACTPPPAAQQRGGTLVAPHANNHVDYVEFSAEDLSVVKAFYGQAFGWSFQDWGPDYVAFSGAGVEGGFRGGEAPAPGGALVILYADDLEASERAVVGAGGEIIARHDFPGGRRFHFRDPAGNVLGVWTIAEENAP
jgi:predicted enzyme related to lactoylglutathione lyase